MNQASPEQARETGIGLHSFGGAIRDAGNVALKPMVFSYETTISVLDTIGQWEVLRNLGGVAEVALGLRDGAHPVKLQGRPARIETFDRADSVELQSKTAQN